MKRRAYGVALALLLACMSCGGDKLDRGEAKKLLAARFPNDEIVEVTGITQEGNIATAKFTARQKAPGAAVMNVVATFQKYDDGWRVTGFSPDGPPDMRFP